eukprot:GHUV01022729.1.p1 GENE.GHUV01022729.1~~GHUV01022729.1.p1  ORF type:complete len:131 (+),score=33.16 GHUV01022729.1:466-858(+)
MAVNCTAGACPLYSTVLMLFRKDLRVYDNPALLAASQAASTVVPVFIWAPEEEGQFQPGRCSKWWLKQTLRDLAQQLETPGSRLIIRRAQDSTDMLLQLMEVRIWRTGYSYAGPTWLGLWLSCFAVSAAD